MSDKATNMQQIGKIARLITDDPACATIQLIFDDSTTTMNVAYEKIPVGMFQKYYLDAAESRAEFALLRDSVIKKIGRQADGDFRRFLASLHHSKKKQDGDCVLTSMKRAEMILKYGENVKFQLQMSDSMERKILVRQDAETVVLSFRELGRNEFVLRCISDMLFDMTLEKMK